MRRLACTLTLLFCLVATPAYAQEDGWPQDALDVSYAVGARIVGMPVPNNITFDQGVEAYMEGATTGHFASFQNGGAVPVHYRNYNTGPSYAAEVLGVVHLFDPLGRIVTMQFLAQYTVNRRTIRITQCMASTTSPSKLTMEVYMVSASLFRNTLPPAQRGDWGAVYRFAKDNAYTPQKDPSRKDTYLVMTFIKNRLPRDAAFEVIVGDKKSASRELDNLVKDNQAYLDYDGWRVHMFSAKLSPTSMRERFYSNYYYTPGLGFIDKMRKRTLAGRYNSKPSATGPNAPMQGRASGPHTSGRTTGRAPAPRAGPDARRNDLDPGSDRTRPGLSQSPLPGRRGADPDPAPGTRLLLRPHRQHVQPANPERVGQFRGQEQPAWRPVEPEAAKSPVQRLRAVVDATIKHTGAVQAGRPFSW